MPRRVLYFFPQIPYPPRSGAHRRALEMLRGLQQLGCQVRLLLSNIYAETEWTGDVRALGNALGIQDVHVYRWTRFDRWFHFTLRAEYGKRGKTFPINSAIHSPPGMRLWFALQTQLFQPDTLFINYAYWDRLWSKWQIGSRRRIIEIHDLLTLNVQMSLTLARALPPEPLDPSQVSDALVCENYFADLGLAARQEEYDIYDHYDRTITLSPTEYDAIRQHTHHTRATLIPMTSVAFEINNTYDALPLLAAGANPFNLQGYAYWAKRILPIARTYAPDLTLNVSGDICSRVKAVEGIELLGFVPEMTTLYQHARFAICPLLGGTGQQVKIVEAMAHGVAVIATAATAKSAPIEHGVNGLIANDAEEFAAYAVQLWNDPALCRKLGQAARTTIATRYSQQRLLDELDALWHD